MPDTPERTLLGFDWGEQRIGVAIGNTITGQARPLEIIASPLREVRFAAIAALLKTWEPDALVVGIPYHPDGTAHLITARCERFVRQLQGRFGLPVIPVDERYSSVAAEADVASRTHGVDAVAAQIILQQYLSGMPKNYDHAL